MGIHPMGCRLCKPSRDSTTDNVQQATESASLQGPAEAEPDVQYNSSVMNELFFLSRAAVPQLPPLDHELDTEDTPAHLLCVITCDVFRDPVLALDGHTYERAAIQHWLSEHGTSPMTNLVLPSMVLVPNLAIRREIEDHAQKLKEAAEAAEAAKVEASHPKTIELSRVVQRWEAMMQLPPMVNIPLEQASQQTEQCEASGGHMVHWGVYCNKSGAHPIVGPRWRKRWGDFNLCNAEFLQLPEVQRSLYEQILHPGATPTPYTATSTAAEFRAHEMSQPPHASANATAQMEAEELSLYASEASMQVASHAMLQTAWCRFQRRCRERRRCHQSMARALACRAVCGLDQRTPPQVWHGDFYMLAQTWEAWRKQAQTLLRPSRSKPRAHVRPATGSLQHRPAVAASADLGRVLSLSYSWESSLLAPASLTDVNATCQSRLLNTPNRIEVRESVPEEAKAASLQRTAVVVTEGAWKQRMQSLLSAGAEATVADRAALGSCSNRTTEPPEASADAKLITTGPRDSAHSRSPPALSPPRWVDISAALHSSSPWCCSRSPQVPWASSGSGGQQLLRSSISQSSLACSSPPRRCAVMKQSQDFTCAIQHSSREPRIDSEAESTEMDEVDALLSQIGL